MFPLFFLLVSVWVPGFANIPLTDTEADAIIAAKQEAKIAKEAVLVERLQSMPAS